MQQRENSQTESSSLDVVSNKTSFTLLFPRFVTGLNKSLRQHKVTYVLFKSNNGSVGKESLTY